MLAANDDGNENVAIIEEEADRAFNRIETSGAIAETLPGDSELEPVDLTTVAAEMADGIADVHDVNVETELPSTVARLTRRRRSRSRRPRGAVRRGRPGSSRGWW